MGIKWWNTLEFFKDQPMITLNEGMFQLSAASISTWIERISKFTHFRERDYAPLYISFRPPDLVLTFNSGWNFFMSRSDWRVLICNFTKAFRQPWFQVNGAVIKYVTKNLLSTISMKALFLEALLRTSFSDVPPPTSKIWKKWSKANSSTTLWTNGGLSKQIEQKNNT